MTVEMVDPTGRIVVELREAAADWPAPLTNYRIAPGELAGTDVPKDGSAPLAIVVRRAPTLRFRRLPLARFDYRLDCYHPDARIAAQIAGLASDALHDRGPRVASGIGIFASYDAGGSGGLVEPDTKWPVERVLVRLTVAAQAIA